MQNLRSGGANKNFQNSGEMVCNIKLYIRAGAVAYATPRIDFTPPARL